MEMPLNTMQQPMADDGAQDARIMQADQHHQEVSGQLDTLIHQNEMNNPEPILDASLQEHVKGNEHLTKIAENTKPKDVQDVKVINTMQADDLPVAFVSIIKGKQGEQGPKGEKGDKGDDGADGSQGPQGETGPMGPQGPQGEIGPEGMQGEPGKDGKDGAAGPMGPRGPAGLDSTNITGKQIVSHLTALEGVDRLSYNSLKDLPTIFRQPVPPASRDYAFTELTDVPHSFVGQGGKVVAVKSDGSGLEFVAGGGGGGAPTDAQYVVLALNGTLTNERVLTGTSNQVIITDNGANSSVVLSLPQNIHTAATPTFDKLTLSSALAFGNDATFGIVNDTSKVFDFSFTFTDATTLNIFGVNSYITYEPSANVTTADTQAVAGWEMSFDIPSSSTHSIDTYSVSGADIYATNNGTGNIRIFSALSVFTENRGTAAITSELIGFYFSSLNNSTGGVTGTLFKDGNFGCAGQTGSNAGTVERDYTFYAETPSHSGTLTKHCGLYMEDQAFGTESWAVQTTGGKVEFGTPTGKTFLLYLSDDDVAHGMTSVAPTNVYSIDTTISSTNGGRRLMGLSASDLQGIQIEGIVGTSTPSVTTPAVKITGAKKNGATDQALASTELLFGVYNLTSLTAAISILANGNSTITGTISVPGAGTSSERFGASATATGARATSLGNTAVATGDDSIIIGQNSSSTGARTIIIGNGIATSSADGVTIGHGASNWSQSVTIGGSANAGGSNSVAIGRASGGGTSTVMIGDSALGSGTNNIGIGKNASVTGSGSAQDSIGIGANCVTGFTNVIAIGSGATATAANQMVIGGTTSITSVFIGKGVSSATPIAVQIAATGGSTTGVNGANLTLAGGLGGAAADKGGDLLFKTAKTGSGTTLTTRLQISEDKIGFFTATPVVQQTSGANLTNNVTSGGTDDTIANFTDLTVYANDAAAIRNDIYQLARKLKQVNDALRALGLLT